jgi:serine/threonine-protein kinase
MLSNQRRVKIMDFGLAKAVGEAQLTRTGTTVGTIAYMSPEQTRGEEVDRRSDIWSLGVVLYEMITGRRPFTGEHEQAVIYSIGNEDPEPVTGLRTGVPIELDNIIRRCLEKDALSRKGWRAPLSKRGRFASRHSPSANFDIISAKIFNCRESGQETG